MTTAPFMLRAYPRAIVHVDADAFFASVEQALDPSLRGRPVVTGKERGIIACASYEAKAAGIKRGTSLLGARALCPGLVVLPSDYESYSLYSKRMFNIMRHFSPVVEEYSIDEAFADLTGLRRVFRCSYEEIAQRIQEAIARELDLSVSVGLSVSKSLAKLCSKFRKPAGFTAVPGRYIHLLLRRTPLKAVWGFGPNTVSLLEKRGLQTAHDFTVRPEVWAAKLLGRPGRDLWNELRGQAVWKVNAAENSAQATIMKCKTFAPPSTDRALIYAKLVRNAESAFIKSRRHKLRARTLSVVLRHHDFRDEGLEARLNRPTAALIEALPVIRGLFERLFAQGCEYRATTVVLGRLEADRTEQYELFEDRLKIEALQRATRAVDAMNRRYGKHTVCAATALFLADKPAHTRDEQPARRHAPLRGENQRRRLAIPRLELKV